MPVKKTEETSRSMCSVIGAVDAPLRSARAKMATSSALCHEPDDRHAYLTDLPEHILQDVLVHLDEKSLCKAAQTCRLFLRVAGVQCSSDDFVLLL